MKYTELEKENAKKYLLDTLKIKCGDKIYSVVMSVSSSGMSRRIKFFVAQNNKIIDVTHAVAYSTNNRLKDYKLSISGCGMDMCFAIVYNLGNILFPNGDGKYITGRNGDTNPETNGGYCLKSVNLN